MSLVSIGFLLVPRLERRHVVLVRARRACSSLVSGIALTMSPMTAAIMSAVPPAEPVPARR